MQHRGASGRGDLRIAADRRRYKRTTLGKDAEDGGEHAAFRLAQNQTFFALDPDCVGITAAIPWDLNRQWLDVIARSGAALFVSPDPGATGAEQKKKDLAEAFRVAAAGGAGFCAEDWLDTTSPERWSVPGIEMVMSGIDGADRRGQILSRPEIAYMPPTRGTEVVGQRLY